MAALLQSYPQSSTTMSILQSPSASASEILPKTSQSQTSHQSSNNKSRIQRNSFHGIGGGVPLSSYRSQSLAASIAPYAFTSTPELNLPGQSSISRTDSEMKIQATANLSLCLGGPENRARVSAEITTPSLEKTFAMQKTGLVNDSVCSKLNRPGSAAQIVTQSAMKSSPGRYRRTQAQSVDYGNALVCAESQLNGNKLEPQSICSFKEFSLQMPQLSDFTNDKHPSKKQQRSENRNPQRQRLVSLQTDANYFHPQALVSPSYPFQPAQRQVKTSKEHMQPRQILNSSNQFSTPHRRDGSTESSNSTHSSRSRSSLARREDDLNATKATSNFDSQSTEHSQERIKSKPEIPEFVEIPTRVSSSDAVRRSFNPSPLSKPIDINSESKTTRGSFTSAVSNALQQPSTVTGQTNTDGKTSSPAAVHLTALNKNDRKKSKNFRLRRAFSFGSAAELRIISSENNDCKDTVSNVSTRKEKIQVELDAEQTRIAQQQEAGGIGSEIYTGQGNVYSRSTDNLSISSTASSASIMIRKMGKGMKKSTRSIVGLFRPKSSTGTSSPDVAAPLASEAHVSMVHVEAERGINLQVKSLTPTEGLKSCSLLTSKMTFESDYNATPSERAGNSSATNSSNKKIIGGEKERADSLASVKKGILKRSGPGLETSFFDVSSLRPSATAFQTPQILPDTDTPNSTAPSTPNDDHQVNQRSRSTTFSNEEFFSSFRFSQNPKTNHDNSPNCSAKRNTTFSPRIQFHDTWPSGEYDRRGEIATCNRLTPMLAQQIKEELNTFKMEMEVHEKSKIYTHFF